MVIYLSSKNVPEAFKIPVHMISNALAKGKNEIVFWENKRVLRVDAYNKNKSHS